MKLFLEAIFQWIPAVVSSGIPWRIPGWEGHIYKGSIWGNFLSDFGNYRANDAEKRDERKQTTNFGSTPVPSVAGN